MAIGQRQSSVPELPGEERVSVPDLDQQTPQGSGLLLGMTAPVFGVGDKLRRLNAAQLFDSLTNLAFNDRSSPSWPSNRGGRADSILVVLRSVSLLPVAHSLGLNFDSFFDQSGEKPSSAERCACEESLEMQARKDPLGR
jgi:hypothetical protein